MEWVKLSAVPAYYHDGAILRAGEAAEVLFCRALAHCGSVESCGLVEKTVLPLLVPTKPQARADALVREGLWLDEGDRYRIRSWEKWQDQHDVAAEKRRKDKERQREHRRKQRDDMSQDISRDLSDGLSRDSHSDTRDSHDVDVEGERERERTQRTTSVVAPRKRAAQGTRIPDDWPLDDDHAAKLRTWADEHTPAVTLRPESDTWQDWHRAKGDTARDWTASWRTWMRRAQADAERGGRPGSSLALVRHGSARPSASEAAANAALEAGARVAARHAAQEGA